VKGIVLAGGRATRLSPASRATSKQLMHVYDKPLVYYPLSTLLHAGINEILIISTPEQLPLFERLLGDGAQWGCSLSYAAQPEPNGIAAAFLIGESFIGEDDVALILGDNIFYGVGLGEQLQRYTTPAGAVVFGLWAPDPERYGVLELDPLGDVVAVHEKPADPPSSYMVPGLYFYANDVVEVARSIEPSARGELEISDVNAHYLKAGRMTVEKLGRGYAWLDTGTPSSLLRAAQFVETVEDRQGLQIGSPEEVAWRKGYIDDAGMERLIQPIRDSEYGKYLQRLLVQG